MTASPSTMRSIVFDEPGDGGKWSKPKRSSGVVHHIRQPRPNWHRALQVCYMLETQICLSWGRMTFALSALPHPCMDFLASIHPPVHDMGMSLSVGEPDLMCTVQDRGSWGEQGGPGAETGQISSATR